MKKSCWEILNKDIYTEEGIEEIEKIYSFISDMIDTLGVEKTNQLFTYWNENGSETFWILCELTNNN